MSADPLGMVDGPNVYCYLNNNPINLIDPLGLCYGEASIEPVPLWEDPIFYATWFGVEGVIYGFSAGEKAVFFSGAGQRARAAASSGIPIFKTIIGSAMCKFEKRLGVELPRIIWDVASAIYAYSAKGTVQVFLNESNYKSTFYRVEAQIIEFLGKAEMIFK